MKRKLVLLIVVAMALALAVLILLRRGQTPTQSKLRSSAPAATTQDMPGTSKVPAHYEVAPSLTSLAVTLPPDKFSGKTRDAYQAAKEIPQTIAQMPCYCYCDRGMGHKSLHSCFEDDHAAHCDVCTNEALMAYRLQKQGLTPKQIRERIIAQFSEQ